MTTPPGQPDDVPHRFAPPHSPGPVPPAPAGSVPPSPEQGAVPGPPPAPPAAGTPAPGPSSPVPSPGPGYPGQMPAVPPAPPASAVPPAPGAAAGPQPSAPGGWGQAPGGWVPGPGEGQVPGAAGYAPGTYHAPGLGGPPPRPPLDALAVASVPAALAGPVGLGLGIAGIARTSGGRRRGRGLAWTGTAIGAVVTAGAVAGGIVLAVQAAGWRELPADVSAPQTVNAVQVTVGNCIEQLPADGEEVRGIRVVPCTNEHHAQVVASTTLPDGAFPGAQKATALASRVCGEDVLGEDPEAELERVVWAPTEASWARGDRTGLCLVWGEDPLTDDFAG